MRQAEPCGPPARRAAAVSNRAIRHGQLVMMPLRGQAGAMAAKLSGMIRPRKR